MAAEKDWADYQLTLVAGHDGVGIDHGDGPLHVHGGVRFAYVALGGLMMSEKIDAPGSN